ncbi:sensor histidine kinase [Halobacteriaceae archaeon SHR40]|uniref:histidine kinase N-terminal 7TM domain-containing protein n=1 Tax=Halovenus amylolytica TaxID=2500550 RepID=UPI000FE3F51B
MGWTPTALSGLVFGNGVILIAIGVYALRKRPDPMAWPLAVLTLAGAAWAIPHAISFGYADRGIITFFYKFIVVGQNLVPLAYLVFALRYAGYDRLLSRRLMAALSVFPTITIVSAWTTPVNDLLWRTITIETVGSASIFVPEYGPWYWLNLTYVYLLIVTALVVFVTVILRSEPIHRKQSLLMFIGGVAPTAMNIPFTLGFGSFSEIDLTTTALAVSGLTFAAALFRYNFLDLSPAAYQNVSDIFGDGVLVFDDSYQLVESNGDAEQILGMELRAGLSAATIFDTNLEALDGTVLSEAEENRFYMARYATLRGHKDDIAGHVVVMRNITDLKEHEQRLSVTNRILRHNLRNELNLISGHAAVLETTLPDDHKELTQIQAAAGRLEAVGEKARHIQSWMDRTDESLQSHDAVPVVESIVSRYRAQFPEARIRLDGPDAVSVLAYDTEQLEIVITNVVENALEHSDRTEPLVEISMAVDEDTATLRVADDGPGIPPTERRIITQGRETKLQHGSSLGLWLIYWLTSAMGGTVEFQENEPRGAVVVVRLHRAS